ncbi:MAG TPA: PQQ-binding-like beta-propeller repeat protein [Anaerolineae bacterium]|nr:PQQ-binding-like beta-propeller repeat protein [Anaerolineae bacterium]
MTTIHPRRWTSIAVIVLVAGLLAACGGSPGPNSWSGLAVSGETAYLTSTDRIYAIDTNPETNHQQRLLWSYPPIGQNAAVTFHSEPFLTDDGILYTGSDSLSNRGAVFALDTTQTIEAGEPPDTSPTVNVEWAYPPDENALPLGSIFGGIAFDGDSVYAGANDGHIVSLNAASGQLNWVYTTTQRIWSTPVVTNATVYVTSQDHQLYALNAGNGSLKWQFVAGAVLAGTPTVYQDTVYAGSFDQKLYAVDAATGAKKWEFTAQGWLWDGPAVADDVLYFGDLSGRLYAVNTEGTAVWTQPLTLEGMIRAQPLIDGDRLYVVTSARKLYAINRTTQKIDWTFTTLQDGESLLTTPELAGDQLLVAPLPAGGSPVRLYALNTRSGNLAWQFPPPAPQ